MSPDREVGSGTFAEKIDMAVFAANPLFRRVSLYLRFDASTVAEASAEAAARFLARSKRSAAEQDAALPGGRADAAAWTAAYARAGMDSDMQPPHEILAIWLDRQGELPSQGPILDLVHGFMLQEGLPVAAYALAGVEGDLWLRPSRGNEVFEGLGGRRPESPDLGEIILADSGKRVLARHWHGAQGRQTLAGPDAGPVLVHLDLLPAGEMDSQGAERGPRETWDAVSIDAALAAEAERLSEAFLDLARRLLGASARVQQLFWEQPEIVWTGQTKPVASGSGEAKSSDRE